MSAPQQELPTTHPDEQFAYHLAGRHRTARLWQIAFVFATIFGIVALTILLINIINGAFGLVAYQNEVDPETLALAANEESMLSTNRVVASEDDTELAQGVAGSQNAIGFFGYAYYVENQQNLKALSVQGIAPSSATAESGEYPLARPLYIYTTAEIMQERPEVAAFVNYYLTHVNDLIGDVGYFAASAEATDVNRAKWLEANGFEGDAAALPEVNPSALTGEIAIAGSSTVFPVTKRVADLFGDDGFEGVITVDSIGSSAGLRRFCENGSIAIANASRAINRAELEACRTHGREPIEFRIGTDALAVVANANNAFLNDVSFEQLQQLFSTAENWSDVNASWSGAPIERFVPGASSGTLDFFVEEVYGDDLASLSKDTLVRIVEESVSAGLLRRLESDQPFAERDRENVLALVLERVVEPKIERTWTLIQSLTEREAIEAEVADIPNGSLEWRAWVNPIFVSTPQSSSPETAGVRNAILGSLWTIAITILFAFPIGVGAAIYLEEYAADSWLNRIIQTNINNLAGVPSIIYGLLGLAIFVRLLEPITSGSLFGVGATEETTLNGRTILSAGLTLGLLVLPVIIISAQEAIRAVPRSLRQASYGLGATKWQTVWNHVLPNALPGILTGTILAISRAIGETAPLVVIGASTFITFDPSGPFSKFTTLPIQIFQWVARPQDEFRNLAAAAIVVLLVLLLTLNAAAILLRNRFSTRRLM